MGRGGGGETVSDDPVVQAKHSPGRSFMNCTSQFNNIMHSIALNNFFERRTVWPPRGKERKHWALRPQKPLRLIRDEEVRGLGILNLTPTHYLHCHHQNDSALKWAVV